MTLGESMRTHARTQYPISSDFVPRFLPDLIALKKKDDWESRFCFFFSPGLTGFICLLSKRFESDG